MNNSHTSAHWLKLALMTVLSFIAMYILMYVMVDRFANVYNNVNQLYMALVMTAAMVAIELVVMRSMYGAWRGVLVGLSVSVIVLGVFFMFTRRQIGVSDEQFLRSMIPHHGAALLMCKQAKLDDPEILQLCDQIIAGQQAEIDFMRQKLESQD